MKTKGLKKKLILKKHTISDLEHGFQANVKGGTIIIIPKPTLYTQCETVCICPTHPEWNTCENSAVECYC